MRQALYKTYGNRRPCGAVSLSNCFGLLVYEPTEEDSADSEFITAWSGSDSQAWGYHRNKIHYTSSGRAYLRKGSLRFYLDEIMRV